MEQVDELSRELTRVPPDEFVGARDALVRRLRGEGRRKEAATIARLRRPSAPLWAVNGLADVAPEQLADLLRAAGAVREGTQAALQGRRVDLGGLSATHGRLVDELTTRAMELLTSAGRTASGDTRARIWSILRNASTDRQMAPLLERGTLLTEPVSTGFEGMEGFALGSPEPEPPLAGTAQPPETAPAPDKAPQPDKVRERAERERAERERAERERAERLHAATEEVEARARRASELSRQLAAVRQRLEEMQAELAQVEREERRLTRAAEEAERASEAARKELERLRT